MEQEQEASVPTSFDGAPRKVWAICSAAAIPETGRPASVNRLVRAVVVAVRTRFTAGGDGDEFSVAEFVRMAGDLLIDRLRRPAIAG